MYMDFSNTASKRRVNVDYGWEHENGVVEWQERGACYRNERAHYLFFSSKGSERRKAMAEFCEGCPVRKLCADFGEATASVGVWGGEDRKRQRNYTPVERSNDPDYGRTVRGTVRKDLIARVAELWDSGHTRHSIQQIIGRSNGMVTALLKEAGITPQFGRAEKRVA